MRDADTETEGRQQSATPNSHGRSGVLSWALLGLSSIVAVVALISHYWRYAVAKDAAMFSQSVFSDPFPHWTVLAGLGASTLLLAFSIRRRHSEERLWPADDASLGSSIVSHCFLVLSAVFAFLLVQLATTYPRW